MDNFRFDTGQILYFLCNHISIATIQFKTYRIALIFCQINLSKFYVILSIQYFLRNFHFYIIFVLILSYLFVAPCLYYSIDLLPTQPIIEYKTMLHSFITVCKLETLQMQKWDKNEYLICRWGNARKQKSYFQWHAKKFP